tara:strand:- start:2484 stop:2762 length:279 start_codon:yes stop_codon:yes gene_type:complete
MNGTPFKRDNTQVIEDEDWVGLFLHGNLIAQRDCDKEIDITTDGWNTMTTRERLNGLPNVRVYNSGSVLYLNGKEWDGSFITVRSEGKQCSL